MEISFLSRRKKRQNPNESTGSTSENSQRQTAEPVASPVAAERPPAARQRHWPGRRKRQEPDKVSQDSAENSQQQVVESTTPPVSAESPPAARRPERRKEPDESSQSSAEKPQQRATEPTTSPLTPDTPPAARHLWGQEFAVVQEGLSQEQVERFVESLKAEYEVRLNEKEASPAWDSFSKQVLAEAEREASRIKLRAKQESEVEASRMISEAKRDVQESMDRAARRAQDITEKQVQDILTAANKKAQITETRARQLSQLMLIRAREDIQDHITGEVRSAYNKLNSMLEDLIGEARSIDGEWREKTLELWSSPALDEDQAALLGSEYVEALPKESEATAQTQEPEIAPEKQVAEPEAAAASEELEVVEQSTSFRESGASSEEPPPVDTSPGEVPSPTVEPSLGEHLPEIIQSADAPAAEDVSSESRETAGSLLPEPSAPVSEPVIETAADSGKQMDPAFQMEAEPKLEVPKVAEPIIPMAEQEEATDILAPEAAEPIIPKAEQEATDILAPEAAEQIIPKAEQEEATDILAANVSELIQVPEKEELESEEGEESLGPSKSEPIIQIPGEEQAPEAKVGEGIVTGGASPPVSLGEVLQPKEVQQPGNQKQEFRDLFSGEVDLVLSPPLDFTRVSELYSHLQTLPDIRVLHTAGSWEQGTVVTVAMESPGPLLSPLNALPTLVATPEVPEGSPGMLRTAMGSLGERGRRRQRINITFKIPQDAKEGQDTDDEGQTGLADV